MSVKQISLDDQNLDSLIKLIDDNKYEFTKITLLFTGSKLADGTSWCPDCNDSEPVINKCLSKLQLEDPVEAQKTLFITVYVGQREQWKNPENEFRKSPFFVKSVPTLLRFGELIRLEESQLANEENVLMFLSE